MATGITPLHSWVQVLPISATMSTEGYSLLSSAPPCSGIQRVVRAPSLLLKSILVPKLPPSKLSYKWPPLHKCPESMVITQLVGQALAPGSPQRWGHSTNTQTGAVGELPTHSQASYSSAPPSADTSTLDYGGQRSGGWPPRGTAWKGTPEAVAGSPSPSSSHTSDKREPCNPLLLSAKGVGRKEEKMGETMTCPAPRSWIISFQILMFKYR